MLPCEFLSSLLLSIALLGVAFGLSLLKQFLLNFSRRIGARA
jgi:hypothetical protein